MSERASKSAPIQQHACDQLLPMAVEGLENIGFVVSDQLPDCELEKMWAMYRCENPQSLGYRRPRVFTSAKGFDGRQAAEWCTLGC